MTTKNKSRKSTAPSVKVTETVALRQKKKRSKGIATARQRASTGMDPLIHAWHATLRNPFRVHGVRIPDMNIAPSAVVTFRRRLILTAIQDGTTGNYGCGIVFSPTTQESYRLVSTYTNTGADPTFGLSNSPQNLGSWPVGFARQYRCVSAGLAVYSTTAMATNNGRQFCMFVPGSDSVASSNVNAAAFAVSAITAAENFEDVPVNMQEICSIVWVPNDETNYDYHNLVAATGASVGTVNYYNPGLMGFFANGIASSATFEVNLVLNCEYLPATSITSYVSIAPSFYSPEAMQVALNSDISRHMFRTVDPESVMTTNIENADLGFNTFLGSVYSGAHGPVSAFANSFARNVGTALGYSAAHVGSAVVGGVFNRITSSLLGLPNGGAGNYRSLTNG